MKHKKRGAQPTPLRILGIIAVFVCALVAALLIGRYLDSRDQKPEERGVYEPTAKVETIEVDGRQYLRRERLTTILLMGVDRPSDKEVRGYRNGGQADFLRLIVIDKNAKTVSQLEIDRDTMTTIAVLGVLGDRSRSRTAQISLSHGFGDGKEQSSELTVEAVSNLLFSTPIDFYMAMNLDGVATLNDAVGGVTVTLEDDFSSQDPAMTKGATLKLNGAQAAVFTRGRMSVADGTNVSRMGRQQQYISALTEELNVRLHESQEFIGTLFDSVKPYLVTNMSRARLINEAWAARDYQRTALYSPRGEHRVGGDGFSEFHPDEEDLKRIVLELFYEPYE